MARRDEKKSKCYMNMRPEVEKKGKVKKKESWRCSTMRFEVSLPNYNITKWFLRKEEEELCVQQKRHSHTNGSYTWKS